MIQEELTRAGVPLDGTMYIGKLMSEPYLSRSLHELIGPTYSLHLRPLFSGTLVWQGKGEIVLASGERIPAQITGNARIIPTPYAVETNFWDTDDAYLSIRASDLTPAQAKEARYFIQTYPSRIERPLRPEEELKVHTPEE